jgi:hypothetical protein
MNDAEGVGRTERRVALDALRRAAQGWSDLAVPDALHPILAGGETDDDTAATKHDGLALHDAWNQLGDLLFNRDRSGFLLAEHAYRLAVMSSADGYAAYRGLGECLARRGRLDEAAVAHDTWFSRWIAGDQTADMRAQQAAAIARGLPPILFIAMQKSASEFIRDSLMSVLEMPLIYASVGTVPADRFIPSALRQLAQGGALCRTHAGGVDDLAIAANAGIDRAVVHLRDPRQVTLSWVQMMRRQSPAGLLYSAPMYNPPVPQDFPGWTFPEQLAWGLAHYLPGQVTWAARWAALVDGTPPLRILMTSYEDFRRDRMEYFRGMLDFLGIRGVDVTVFAAENRQAIRNFRSGRIDEWTSVLTQQQRAAAWRIIAPIAPRFGWSQ